MTRHVLIGLSLRSELLAAGVRAMLKSVPGYSVTFLELTEDGYVEEIARHRPAAVVVDPAYCALDLEALKSPSATPCKVVGLLTTQLPREMARHLDHTVGLYDTSESMAALLEKIVAKPRNEAPRAELSAREKEVLTGVVKGLSNKEIAEKMHVSVNTVMTHRRNIVGKLHIHSAAGLTIYAIINGIVNLDEVSS